MTTVALLSGCAANPASTPAAAKNTQAEECERGGGWWRVNLDLCEAQGTGKQ